MNILVNLQEERIAGNEYVVKSAMLISNKLPKRRVIEIIPEDMISDLKKVSDLIKLVSLKSIEKSEKLIKGEKTEGRLFDAESGEFWFHYYPDRNNKNGGEWAMRLFVHEIEAICNNEKQTMLFWACMNDECKYRGDNPEFLCQKHDQYDDGKPLDNSASWERIKKLRQEREAKEAKESNGNK